MKRSDFAVVIRLITEGILKEMDAMQDDSNQGDNLSINNWLSRCCQMPALGELNNTDPQNPVGICRGCQGHATFEPAVKEQNGMGAAGGIGASVTGNISSITGPNAFKRKKTMEDYEAARAGTAGYDPKNPNQRKPWRHIDSGFFEISGRLASKLGTGSLPKNGWERIVKAPEGFPSESGWVWLARTKTMDNEGHPKQVWSIRQALRGDPYAEKQPKESITPLSGMEEIKIDETSTSANAGAYNIPGWVSRKGGSKLGVAGSEKLGYTLTSLGKKEMGRSGDALLEGKRINETAMGQLGSKFGDAQSKWDAQRAEGPPDEPEIECPNCGEDAYFTSQYTKGQYYQWKAKCPHCGHKWGDDNF